MFDFIFGRRRRRSGGLLGEPGRDPGRLVLPGELDRAIAEAREEAGGRRRRRRRGLAVLVLALGGAILYGVTRPETPQMLNDLGRAAADALPALPHRAPPRVAPAVVTPDSVKAAARTGPGLTDTGPADTTPAAGATDSAKPALGAAPFDSTRATSGTSGASTGRTDTAPAPAAHAAPRREPAADPSSRSPSRPAPDADAARSLDRAIVAYWERARLFGRRQMTCDDLAVGALRVRVGWSVYSRAAGARRAMDAATTGRYRSLRERLTAVENHFRATGCPRS